MRKTKFDFEKLNRDYSIDNYINIPHDKKIQLRIDLMDCIRKLKKRFKIKLMTPEDVLSVGLRANNKTATALVILIELRLYSYERMVYFTEVISILRKQLLDELYNGKNIFYPIDENVIGIDPNYVSFILGKNFDKLKLK